MKKSYDVVVAGGANVDYIIRGKQLPRPGTVAAGDAFVESAGGKGVNQAVAAARLGAKVAFVGQVGSGADGELILQALKSEGVETRWIRRDERDRSGAVLISVDEQGQVLTHAYPGANRNLHAQDIFAVTNLISQSRVLLLQLDIPREAAFGAIRIASGTRTKVVLDPAPAPSDPIPEEILALCDVIRMNQREAEALTGIAVHDRDSARLAAERLIWKKSGGIIVQAGPDENLLLYQDHELRLPTYSVPKADESGAGDAFSAAVAVAISEERSLSEAATFGNAAAGLAVTRPGSLEGLPRRSQVIELLRQDGIDYPESPRRRRPTEAA